MGMFDLRREIDLIDFPMSKRMSKQMSAIHSENVKFNYEYEVPNGTGNETVYISGQFDNWDFEEM
jgi:hypothetical protein